MPLTVYAYTEKRSKKRKAFSMSEVIVNQKPDTELRTSDFYYDLPQELIEKYTEQFRQAYDFALVGNILMPIPLSE